MKILIIFSDCSRASVCLDNISNQSTPGKSSLENQENPNKKPPIDQNISNSINQQSKIGLSIDDTLPSHENIVENSNNANTIDLKGAKDLQLNKEEHEFLWNEDSSSKN